MLFICGKSLLLDPCRLPCSTLHSYSFLASRRETLYSVYHKLLNRRYRNYGYYYTITILIPIHYYTVCWTINTVNTVLCIAVTGAQHARVHHRARKLNVASQPQLFHRQDARRGLTTVRVLLTFLREILCGQIDCSENRLRWFGQSQEGLTNPVTPTNGRAERLMILRILCLVFAFQERLFLGRKVQQNTVELLKIAESLSNMLVWVLRKPFSWVFFHQLFRVPPK